MRIWIERLVAAPCLGDDAGGGGEDVILVLVGRVHDVLHRALAFLHHQGEGAVPGQGQGLGELLGKRVIWAVGLAGMNGDGRLFRAGRSDGENDEEDGGPQSGRQCPYPCHANQPFTDPINPARLRRGRLYCYCAARPATSPRAVSLARPAWLCDTFRKSRTPIAV